MNRTYSIIIALLLSLILWISVALSDFYSTNINVPVKMINVPNGYTVSNFDSNKVNIRIRGEGWKLADILLGRTKEYEVSAEFDSGKRSINYSEALSDNAWIANDVQVFGIYPDSYEYQIEKVQNKKFKIFPIVNLDFRSDYGLASEISLFPDSITAFAPHSILRKIDSIPTIPIDFELLDKDVDMRVDLEYLTGVRYERNFTNLKFKVEKIVDKKIDNIEIKIKNVPPNEQLIVFPNKISVVLRGGINILGKLNEQDISASISYSEIIEDTLGIVKPTVSQPDFTNIIDVLPSTLKYTIKKFE